MLREPFAFGPYKLMKYLMRNAQSFYMRHFVKDEMKRYIRADEKEIIMSSCGLLARFRSM